MSGFIKSQLATLKGKEPSGAQWLHEIKYDGYRIQLHFDDGNARAFTRNGLNWLKRFSVMAGSQRQFVQGPLERNKPFLEGFSMLSASTGRLLHLAHEIFEIKRLSNHGIAVTAGLATG